jgi:hypothetical protein
MLLVENATGSNAHRQHEAAPWQATNQAPAREFFEFLR